MIGIKPLLGIVYHLLQMRQQLRGGVFHHPNPDVLQATCFEIRRSFGVVETHPLVCFHPIYIHALTEQGLVLLRGDGIAPHNLCRRIG